MYILSEIYFWAVANLDEQEQQKCDKRSKEFVYYFAYGSTMNQQFLEEKIGPVKFVSQAILPGFQLGFARPQVNSKVRATIIPHSQVFVEGAVYKINRLQLSILDVAKGDCFACHRYRFYVKKHALSLPIPVELHAFDFDLKLSYQPPAREYMATMIKGAENIKVSKAYLDAFQYYAPVSQKSKL